MSTAGDGATGHLTTHVLDTMSGEPGSGIVVDLFRIDGVVRQPLRCVATDADGRTPTPLLDGADFVCGRYELLFHVGAYFRARGAELPEPAFIDQVPVRFGIADAARHYHVPLLVSPYGYTTYRGS